jgi:peptidoglycan hydrolase-like protein with peptidoglycan-binding domain
MRRYEAVKTALQPKIRSFNVGRRARSERELRPVSPSKAAHSGLSDRITHSMQGHLGNRAMRRLWAKSLLQPKLGVTRPDGVNQKKSEEAVRPSAAGAIGDRRPSSDQTIGGKQPAQRSVLQRIPIRALQQNLGNRGLSRLLRDSLSTPADSHLSRRCACEGSAKQECDDCRTHRLARHANAGDESVVRKMSMVERSLDHQQVLQRVHLDNSGRKLFDCPDFAGDKKLEACLNDEDRLRPREPSATVAKIQNALLKDGANLGPDGADGKYGAATGQAVMAFKSKYKLGFEKFPDVGPGTMAKLDELCAKKPEPKPPQPKPPAPERCFDTIDWNSIFEATDEECRLNQSSIDAACALAPNSPFNLGPDVCPKTPFEERVEDCVLDAAFLRLVETCGIPAQPPGKAEIRKLYKDFRKSKGPTTENVPGGGSSGAQHDNLSEGTMLAGNRGRGRTGSGAGGAVNSLQGFVQRQDLDDGTSPQDQPAQGDSSQAFIDIVEDLSGVPEDSEVVQTFRDPSVGRIQTQRDDDIPPPPPPFPTGPQMVLDLDNTALLWNLSCMDRRERGYYIFWNDTTKKSSSGPVVRGEPWTTEHCRNGAELHLGAVPPDHNHSFTVGFFHTHPPAPPGCRKTAVGPSQKDLDTAKDTGLPGIVRDGSSPTASCADEQQGPFYFFGPNVRHKS